MPYSPMFKLHQNPDSMGLRCDRDGLFFAGQALLERDEEGLFEPRRADVVRKLLNDAFGTEVEWASQIRSTNVVADALNKGELAKAMIAAVLMRLPEPEGAIRNSGVLAKAGYNPDEPRDDRGRWTTGQTSASSPVKPTPVLFEPFVEPLIGEMLDEPPIKPMPNSIDILPPTLGPRERWTQPNPYLRNPYPHRSECEEQWQYAHKECAKLRRKGKLAWDDSRRYPLSYRQCVLGMVTEDCGGSAVVY